MPVQNKKPLTVVVIGASGFIGSAVCAKLETLGFEVIRTSSRKEKIIDKWKILDLRNKQTIQNIVSEMPSYVLNFAGVGLGVDKVTEKSFFEINIAGPQLLLHEISQISPSTKIFQFGTALPAGSGAGKHMDMAYSLTKNQSTSDFLLNLDLLGLDGLAVNLNSVYGTNQPRGRFVSSAIEKLTRGEVIYLENPNTLRDFVYIEDVSYLIVSQLQSEKLSSRTVEIGTGIQTSVYEACVAISKALGAPKRLIEINGNLVKTIQLDKPIPQNMLVAKTSLSEGIMKTISNMKSKK